MIRQNLVNFPGLWVVFFEFRPSDFGFFLTVVPSTGDWQQTRHWLLYRRVNDANTQ